MRLSRAPSTRVKPWVGGIAITVALMVFSSNPIVLDAQRGVGHFLRPVAGAVGAVAGTVGSVTGAIGDVDGLRSDNARLRRDNDRLAVESERLEGLRRDNDRLAALLALREGLEYASVAAEVIAAEASDARRVVTIGKGSDDGIAAGDVIISEGGALVGRVLDAGPSFAHVRLITDTGSTVIGRLPGGATGEVVGELGTVVAMGRIDATEPVAAGDTVVTAGIVLSDGIRSAYPKGLLIGQVVDVRRDPNAVVQTAWLLPAAPLDRLEYVLAITGYEGGLPLVAPTP